MANFSLKELTDVLKKSGLPMGDSGAMGLSMPGAPSAIAGAAPQFQGQESSGRAPYQAQLQKIAEMDQRLKQLYGDPTSPMFIENPLARTQVETGQVGSSYKNISGFKNDVLQEEETSKREAIAKTKDIISETLALYKSLKTAVKQLEDEPKKQEAKIKSEETKAKTSETKKLAAEADRQGLTTTELKRLRDGQVKDPKAKEFFLGLPTAFQKEWARKVSEPLSVFAHPKEGYSMDELDKEYQDWQAKQKAIKGKTTREPLFK